MARRRPKATSPMSTRTWANCSVAKSCHRVAGRHNLVVLWLGNPLREGTTDGSSHAHSGQCGERTGEAQRAVLGVRSRAPGSVVDPAGRAHAHDAGTGSTAGALAVVDLATTGTAGRRTRARRARWRAPRDRAGQPRPAGHTVRDADAVGRD